MAYLFDMKETIASSWNEKKRQNVRYLAIATGAWLVSLAFIYFGHRYLWQQHTIVTAVAIAINVMLGGAMVWANKRHLAGLDELQQKIQLEAMSVSLGIGMVFGFAYAALDKTELIPFNAEISHLAVIMSIGYLWGVFRGVRKFQ